MGYDNWTETIEGWIEEKEYYVHTYPSTSVFSHYTQVRMPQESSQTAIIFPRLDDLAFIGFNWLWRDGLSFVRTEQYIMVFLRLQLHPRVNNNETLPTIHPWKSYRSIVNSNYHPAYEQGTEDQPLHGNRIGFLSFAFSPRDASLDCQGKVCLYNGILNLDTCECQCSSYATGMQCEQCEGDRSISPRGTN